VDEEAPPRAESRLSILSRREFFCGFICKHRLRMIFGQHIQIYLLAAGPLVVQKTFRRFHFVELGQIIQVVSQFREFSVDHSVLVTRYSGFVFK
jgi:hypothetical protein